MASISLQEGGAYQSLQMVLQNEFGIVIGEERQNSITSRLKPVIAEFSLESLDALVNEMKNSDAVDIRNSVLHAITTYEHEWFRPKELFNLFDEYLLAEILNPERERYRIWVIGCGAGQLPYSVAMKTHLAAKNAQSSTRIDIETTDTSDVVVRTAARGVYDAASLEGMDDTCRNRYMDEVSGHWQVVDEIKSMVAFSTCNLLEDFEDKGHFDLIVCLDVMVYFSVPIKVQLLDSFANLLDPSGVLIAGMNEPVLPFNRNFDMVRHDAGIFYRQTSD